MSHSINSIIPRNDCERPSLISWSSTSYSVMMFRWRYKMYCVSLIKMAARSLDNSIGLSYKFKIFKGICTPFTDILVFWHVFFTKVLDHLIKKMFATCSLHEIFTCLAVPWKELIWSLRLSSVKPNSLGILTR